MNKLLKPVIAIIGRHNVGKSTLFNLITNSRNAIVDKFPGLTRDRNYGTGIINRKYFTIIDTCGIEFLNCCIYEQTEFAIAEANIILFLVDAKLGVTPYDEEIAKYLRIKEKNTWLVVNKIDCLLEETVILDFFSIGIGHPYPISASQGRNVNKLMKRVLEPFYSEKQIHNKNDIIHIGIIGRQNVGKSTLINCLLGENRMLVLNKYGTTRDAIKINLEYNGKKYVFFDTAGICKRSTNILEKLSILKTIDIVKYCNVVIMVLDAQLGVVNQDLHILNYILESGSAVVIVVNKWDKINNKNKKCIEIRNSIGFNYGADLHFISALHNTTVKNIYPSIERTFKSTNSQWTTHCLTTILKIAVNEHQPPIVSGRRIKLRLAHQGGINPPIIILHGRQTKFLPQYYKRYIINTYCKALKIIGTPIRFEYRSNITPYVINKN
ncbi:GTPase Der [Candidatus Johnevansia muelleri]|uniref:GTPase Der n=1 Tax=Candidatus Johnevansia muelleri TaxID=1495769 RepID=A0A078KHN4_9GAMM|nr:GTPase Der [Candidatus Evansia muelleri]